MTKEQKYAAELKKLGIYEKAFDASIHQLAILEREQARTRKSWKETAETGEDPSTLDKHYAVILQQDKMIHMLRESLGLTPKSLRRIRAEFGKSEQIQAERPKTMLEIIQEKKRSAG